MSGAMITGTQSARGASPFSRGAILAVVVVGFAAFIAMLYFLAAGDTGNRNRNGAAHASANGLNGYAALAELLDAEGYSVSKSRERGGLETTDLLILTPPPFTDAEEFAEILRDRDYLGPTLVILPKWSTAIPSDFEEIADDDRARMQSDWVKLLGANALGWPSELPEPFTFTHEREELEIDAGPYWEGLSLNGVLPTKTVLHAETDSSHEKVMETAGGRTLAFNVVGDAGTDYYESAHWTMFVVEPDLMNNYGLADPQRAAAALALVREAGYGDMDSVTFDLTLNGLGQSANLLTLAFRPPFLAATLCLILAMLIVGWRAFLRFGAAAIGTQEIAFGKGRLVTNGAGLIVRARRLGLLAAPYAALIERRLGRALGIAKPDTQSIDEALARRLPDEEPFSSRAARLKDAEKPTEILRAAQALNDLTDKLSAHK